MIPFPLPASIEPDVLALSDGGVVIGSYTQADTVYKLKGGKLTTITWATDGSSNMVAQVQSDDAHGLWVIEDHGFYYLDSKNKERVSVSGQPLFSSLSVREVGKDNALWVEVYIHKRPDQPRRSIPLSLPLFNPTHFLCFQAVPPINLSDAKIVSEKATFPH